MANPLIPVEERSMTPEEIGALDKRRSRGFMLLVVSGQFAIVTCVLLLWVGQDLTYSPGWAHPIAYYFALAISISVITGLTGIYMRRGTPEF